MSAASCHQLIGQLFHRRQCLSAIDHRRATSHQYSHIDGFDQGESVNILLNFTQFFETRIEYRFQI
ncbi:hypothetical protein, partial [Aeromonas sp. QDB02]|uniref:hypothetical protein n=1 Tax=Aeromonas sp. QDB02 TaxID=2990476 RepID=UPI0022DF5822